MENLRFSIIENNMKWNSSNMDYSSELEDNKSISSESSGDAILNDESHTLFHRNQRTHAIWNCEEVEETFKKFKNFDEILKMLTWGNFNNIKSGSDDVNLALLLSTWYGCAENIFILLESYLGDPNCTDPKGRTPLHFACCIGEAQIAKILLDHGADPNKWDKENKATPLHCAASAGSVDCILLLLKRRAHIDVGIDKRTPLHFAIDQNAVECVETLLKYGADPNTPQVFTETPLHTACALGHSECVKLLLKYGADVRSQFGKRKLTALHLAAEDDYVECVKLLLDHGTSVDSRNADNQTPLHLACLSQCIETLEILIKYGANVNAVYRDGRTSLHAAIVKQSKCVECVKILIKAGADVNKADIYGYTPLHIAALNEFSSCVYTLIESGADITARTNGGVSALSFIVRRTPDIIPKLIEKFNSSIKVNDHEIGDVDCEIKLDFRLLVPCLERGETELLLNFIEVGQKRILTHPLCETFLFLKWRRIRKFFLISLLYHAIYVLMFTMYIVGVYIKNCKQNELPCSASGYSSSVGYIVIILNLILLGKEFFQMSHGIYGYIRYWENWLQWSIIFGVFLCVTPGTFRAANLQLIPEWQHHIAAFVIFLVWLELMMLVGRFPIFGVYVQMFTKVAVNFSKFLLAYCCLIIAFALSFCVLFSNYPAFESIPWSILKAITMMSGELEFEDIFYGDYPILYPVTSHILFLAFVLLVTVILTNLLVGLAVSDIQGLQVSASLDRLTRQAELVSRLESLFFSRLLKKAPYRLRLFFRKTALLRTSRYGLQFMTRPNDPRDKQLPNELKLNIYKLVAERRDRNQSIKRRKREENFSFFQRNLERQATTIINGVDSENSILRPKSLMMNTNTRYKVLSDNPQNINNLLNNKNSNVKNEMIMIDLSDVKEQLKNINDKLDKFNDTFIKKLNLNSEELSRIKMLLDQKPMF